MKNKDIQTQVVTDKIITAKKSKNIPGRMVVTDLDGTLLDHHSYDYIAAQPALEQLNALAIPVIFSSSKTRAEILHLRKKMGNQCPFIVENGSAICGVSSTSDKPDIMLGATYVEIRRTVEQIREETGFHFTGFGDMSAREVAECTGLPVADAELARQREFSEPLLWQDSSENKSTFISAVRTAGLNIQQGGRFLTVSGPSDKGRAVNWLREYFGCVEIIALGDSPNDESMLNAADIAVIVCSDKSSQLDVTGAKKIIRTKERGPEGWCRAIMAILAILEGKE